MTWICDLTIKDIHVLLTSNTSVVESLWTPQPTKYKIAGHEQFQPQFSLFKVVSSCLQNFGDQKPLLTNLL